MSRLYHRIQVAAHLLKKHADRRLLDAAGITTAQAAVLVIVAEQHEPTQRAVANQLGISQPAVTSMTERLTTAGLLERRRSDTDGRAWRLRLTSEGRESLTAARDAFSEVNALLGEAIGKQRIVQLDTELDGLIRQLTEGMRDR